MGYRCRWLAVRGRDRAQVLAQLPFTVSQELNEAVFDPGLYAMQVGDWLVVIGDGWDYKGFVEPEQAAKLSLKGETVFFYCDDTPMCAELVVYAAGIELWSIIYEGMDGISTPRVAGAPPEIVSAELARASGDQEVAGGTTADVDYIYDGVAEAARALVGFRHDQTLSSGQHLPLWVLAPTEQS